MKNPGRPKEAYSWLQLGEACIPESGDLGQAGRRMVLQVALTLLRHPKSMAGHCDPGAVSGPGLASAELGDFSQIHTDPRCLLRIVTAFCGREAEERSPPLHSRFSSQQALLRAPNLVLEFPSSYLASAKSASSGLCCTDNATEPPLAGGGWAKVSHLL